MSVAVYISEEKIAKRIEELGKQISKDYKGKELHVIGVLKGSFVFLADLVRKIDLPITMDFISASSYGDSTTSSGRVNINLDISKDLRGKHVLLVEDIVDTGLTIKSLIELFKSRNPDSVKLASLLYKPARIKHQVTIDYLGFEIEDKFVIGYGLDYADRYRELPFIGVYSEGH